MLSGFSAGFKPSDQEAKWLFGWVQFGMETEDESGDVWWYTLKLLPTGIRPKCAIQNVTR